MSYAIIDKIMGTPLEQRHLIKWEEYRDVLVEFFANEVGHLAQGIHDINGTNTIYFVPCSAIHKGA